MKSLLPLLLALAIGCNANTEDADEYTVRRPTAASISKRSIADASPCAPNLDAELPAMCTEYAEYFECAHKVLSWFDQQDTDSIIAPQSAARKMKSCVQGKAVVDGDVVMPIWKDAMEIQTALQDACSAVDQHHRQDCLFGNHAQCDWSNPCQGLTIL